ncbi:hypothetical protein CABS01_00287 [Colletotrichum abscissum]|uniref:Uncharacterized protein n=1 Tax=Colletotrichum abscissum TaxID=1671311 RepID=A0A9P9XAB3_9PEZI|nr:uncharacterized protein CABS01_00287 [Colletotrichum abscissum]KAI3544165.1 hypothetical protein CABS02_09839 [Colletotrichum abscissum]KAK1525198.1 hypothetical protein CABS01_00287 [Colletotrichum abscissum]
MARLTTSVQTPNSGREVWCVATSLAHIRHGLGCSTNMQVGMKRTSINGPNANANHEASKPWSPASSSPRPPPPALSSIVYPVMEGTGPRWERRGRGEGARCMEIRVRRGGDLEAGPRCMHRAPRLP